LIGGVASLSGLLAARADWPQWRGPNRDGQVVQLAPPSAWPKTLQRQWKVEVGEGHASPVVSGQRVFVLSREGEDEVVRAIALADGKELWSQRYPAPFQMSPYARSHGKGPKSTPVVAGGCLYTHGIDSIVSAWDAETGKRLWQQDFSKRFTKTSSLFYGSATSPIIDGDRLITFVGRLDDGALVALARDSGKSQWEWTGDGPGYASTIVATLGGVKQLVTQSQNACIAISAAAGSLLWKLPFKTEYDQNIVTPVAAGDLIIFAGLEHPTAAYRLTKDGDAWKPQQVWENADRSMYMSSPVVIGDRLVGFSQKQKGQFFCLDLVGGKGLWTSEGRLGDNAAILAWGPMALALTTNSELMVFKPATGRFEPVARYRVADKPTWAHPAPVAGGILIKDALSLALWTWE
jgi:outer membrane protein assembly factor BamB